MAQKRHLWYMDLVLTTLERLGNIVIGNVIAKGHYQPKFRSLGPPHGQEEAPVVHGLGPGHLDGIGQPQHWVVHGQYEHPSMFHICWWIFVALILTLKED